MLPKRPHFLFLLMILVNYIHSLNATLEKSPVKVTSKVYANLFVRRREEHKMLLQHLRTTDSYEKKYKLIELAFQKILNGLRESKTTLEDVDFNSVSEFPEDQNLADAFAFILENTCLVGDLVLHFPDVSYRILRSVKDWKALMNWCIIFTKKADPIVDDLSQKMLDLFNQEINEDQRTKDYFNPYLEANQKKQEQPIKEKPKKVKKKIKKGPQLSGRSEL